MYYIFTQLPTGAYKLRGSYENYEKALSQYVSAIRYTAISKVLFMRDTDNKFRVVYDPVKKTYTVVEINHDCGCSDDCSCRKESA